MNQLNLNLKNCFGIDNLECEFDFTKFNTKVIYASNGIMKTSFAKTFKALEEGRLPVDLLHSKPTSCEIQVDNQIIESEFISVIKSFDTINTEKSQSKLLVDPASKQEYDEIFSEILDKKRRLEIDLNKLSGVKKDDIEEVVKQDFNSNDYHKVLLEFTPENLDQEYSNIKYTEIFNPEVIDFLQKPNVQENIEAYFEKYTELLENSTLFKAGVFNPSKAETIANTLKKENFFEAKHKVKLNGIDEEFESFDSLNNRLLEERKEILENTELLNIEKQIKKAAVKKFRELLEKTHIIKELANLEVFKKKLWISYFNQTNIQFHIADLNTTYTNGIEKLRQIEQKATEQATAWDNVIKKFGERFFVPFNIQIENKSSTILGKGVHNIQFTFNDEETGNEAVLKKETLNKEDILSQGEKRAMYLLNVMFNIEARRKEGTKTLFIFDDIADSFDYKNKYAIIQYLQDISTLENFYQIILTHNFDFFRTIQSRILGGGHRRDCSYMAQKNIDGITLFGSGHNYQDNPFKNWRKNLSNQQMLIASIPFVRILIEFKEDETSDEFLTLTSLLHIKDDTKLITVADLKGIYQNVITSTGLNEIDDTKLIFDILEEEIENILNDNIDVGLNLEKKIVLSIGIRYRAEEYMWSKVTDKNAITKNQTWNLFKRFKLEFSETAIDEISILDKVNLITPENIHLNSFMFEPILDLSIDHLVDLYTEIKSLQ